MLYLNSYFNPDFTIYPLLQRKFGSIQQCPIVIIQRDEFSNIVMQLKRFIKRVYMPLVRLFKLYKIRHGKPQLSTKLPEEINL